jgi:hypothetical protein
LSSLFWGERQDDDWPEVDEKSDMMMQDDEIVSGCGELMTKEGRREPEIGKCKCSEI